MYQASGWNTPGVSSKRCSLFKCSSWSVHVQPKWSKWECRRKVSTANTARHNRDGLSQKDAKGPKITGCLGLDSLAKGAPAVRCSGPPLAHLWDATENDCHEMWPIQRAQLSAVHDRASSSRPGTKTPRRLRPRHWVLPSRGLQWHRSGLDPLVTHGADMSWFVLHPYWIIGSHDL